jgi:hypothetical protein
MKKCFFLIIMFFPLVFLVSCKKEKKDDNNQTTVIVEFKAKMNGENLVIKSNQYNNISGYKIKFETLRLYLSNLKLVKTDNNEVMLKDIDFLDFSNNHNSNTNKGERIITTAPAGQYKALKFAIGVDPSLNNGDPSVYPNDHPLSIYNGQHWNWNTGYIFYKLEGRYDTAGVNADNAPFFLYHVGLNALYKENELLKNIYLIGGDTSVIRIIIHADKIFYNSSDTIDLATDNFTHTTDNYSLAERVNNNLSASMTIE